MNIPSITSPSPTLQGKGKQPLGAAAKAAGDFTTFLTLLTTQLRNQDPLKPLNSTDFVAQLASFSGVEQQVRTNDNLGAIKTLLGGGDASSLASWVGMDVRAPRNINFSGAPVDIHVAPAARAERADLVVYNAAGAEIQRQAVPLGSGTRTWAGVASDGSPLPSGQYRFALESYQNSQLIETSQPSVYGSVAEARNEGTKTILVLTDGTEVPTSDVSAVRGATASK